MNIEFSEVLQPSLGEVYRYFQELLSGGPTEREVLYFLSRWPAVFGNAEAYWTNTLLAGRVTVAFDETIMDFRYSPK